MNTLIVVLGPTGVGKTEVCLQIAEHFGIPVINADSRQLFKELPIGTAAPTEEEQKRVRHFFVATHHVGDYYSAAMFEEDVMRMLDKMFGNDNNTNHLALMSGGSMMYVDAVCNGIDEIPTIDDNTRAGMRARYEAEGLDALLESLKQLDPEYYAIVDRKNPKRVIHALEICTMTGKTYTSFRRNEKKQRPFNILKIGIDRPREELYHRINTRVEQMFDKGLVQEAKAMYALRNENALNTVGYKELFAFFDGKTTQAEALEKIQSNTRRYARKQMTWYRKATDIKWFHPENTEEIINYIEKNT